MSPYTLMDELDPLAGIRRYEVEQPNAGALILHVQPAAGADRPALQMLAAERCRRVIPEGVAVSVELADAFAVDPSRKRRFIRRAAEGHAA
jgi:hypothetical protein